MKKNFQFYKNIILLVASALTLVAVTFAWFSVSYVNQASQIGASVLGDGALIDVNFYKQDENNEYLPLQDDIKLENFAAGSYNRYQILITTKTADKLQVKFSIEDLPQDISEDLLSSVCVKYSLYSTAEAAAPDGTVSYADGELISESNDYVPLSEIENGIIFDNISLKNYQADSEDVFILYYEIGLSENSPSTIEGVKSSLGRVNINAQRVS